MGWCDGLVDCAAAVRIGRRGDRFHRCAVTHAASRSGGGTREKACGNGARTRRGRVAACHSATQAAGCPVRGSYGARSRSEEHTSELQSLMRISYAAFCLKKKKLN